MMRLNVDHGLLRRAIAFAAIAGLWLLLSNPASAAKPPAQPTFSSPEQAMDALVAAVRARDKAKVANVLGPGSEKLVSSGDPVADRSAGERFLAAVAEGTKPVKRDDGSVIFEIGKNEWPFPIPVVAAGGNWRFDSKAGAEEILDRRIGANELDAIQISLAYVDAQREYASVDWNHDGFLEYAQKFLSDPGMRDGLYWQAEVGEKQSPMGPLMAEAQAHGYYFKKGQRTPYHGYYYRILKAQGPHALGGAMDYVIRGHMIGGFAMVAYPAEYGSSGIMTFIVNHEGVVYQKDLGPKTAEIASKMTAFDPDPSWKKAEQ
ncbi:MAG TPA: DUF2950 domain-containing protein [Stellaceae bacterium]|nr:DUF2950 domain-containing protein [Stellaceae bacterium]